MNATGKTTGYAHLEFQCYNSEQVGKYIGIEGNDPVPGNKNPVLEKPERPTHVVKNVMIGLLVIIPIIVVVLVLLKLLTNLI